MKRQTLHGFTIMELVVVIVVSTILAALASSRINTASFTTEGYANRAAAMLRYAQKLAIAQHRDVFVAISGNTISLCYVNSGCGTPVHEPPGASAFTYAAPSGVTLSGLGTFSFNALGKPSAAGTLVVTGDVVRNIVVTAETGYISYVP